ncbi:hypothetical protein [Paenibacillus polymyxa]|uniref:hypothetical protein n=1 Tax=Paenibacillus polymyxa TaxID=1406 RepID=UPI002024D802|nr:hypothetical protein [Paenibacillus polymyxa]URJ60926.1 hypothetical protein MF622_000597 [Paenibacillus polymyxa]
MAGVLSPGVGALVIGVNSGPAGAYWLLGERSCALEPVAMSLLPLLLSCLLTDLEASRLLQVSRLVQTSL